MHAEDLTVNDGGEGEEVEEISVQYLHTVMLPYLRTLVIEPVHLGDLSGLVVAADQVDSVRVAHLERSAARCLDTEASVNKIPHEEVICVRHIAPRL